MSLLANMCFAVGLLLAIVVYMHSRFITVYHAQDKFVVYGPISVHCAWYVAIWLAYIGTVFQQSNLSINIVLWLVVFFTVCVVIKQCQDWLFVVIIYWFIAAIGTQHRPLWLVIIGISAPVPFLAADAFFQTQFIASALERWSHQRQKGMATSSVRYRPPAHSDTLEHKANRVEKQDV